MDKQTLKQIDDLDAMRQASRMYYQTLVAEKIGITTLRLLHHRKPSLIKRILGLK